MRFILIFIFLLSSFHSFAQRLIHPEEYSIEVGQEIQLTEYSFLYLKLSPRGMNSITTCISCTLSKSKEYELKKMITANILPSLVATRSVLYTDPSRDKLRHFSAGYVAGNLTTGALQILIPKTQKNKKLYAFLGGVGASVVIGLGKEFWDSLGHGQVEFKDALATITGGVSGSLTINLYDLFKKR
jgi:hypothetical protein